MDICLIFRKNHDCFFQKNLDYYWLVDFHAVDWCNVIHLGLPEFKPENAITHNEQPMIKRHEFNYLTEPSELTVKEFNSSFSKCKSLLFESL